MARKKIKPNELVLNIDSWTPETIPMDRLAKYLEQFAALLGNDSSIHFVRVERGSCKLRAFAEDPALPKVKDRANQINDGTAPRQALKARADLDDLLAEDNAIGDVTIGNSKLIEFPGRKRNPVEEIGPVSRRSTIDGQVYSIGGKDSTINVKIRDGDREMGCVVSVDMARRLAKHLFGQPVRLAGEGQWYRVDGKWIMKSLIADELIELRDESLASSLSRISGIFAGVDPDEFMAAMKELREE